MRMCCKSFKAGLFVVFFLLLGMHLLPSLLAQEGIQIEAEASPVISHVGVPVTFTVRVRAPVSVQIEFPEVGEQLAGFRILDFSPLQEEVQKDQKIVTRQYVLSTYVSGETIIPPLQVTLKDGESQQTWVSGALPLKIVSRLNQGPETLRDIAPPYVGEMQALWHVWLLWVCLPLGVLGLLGWFIWIFQKQKLVKEITHQTPWELALEALDELTLQQPRDASAMKQFYSQLSDILRLYIEDRFKIMAPERTTEEFIKTVKSHTELRTQDSVMLGQFLKECDLVKFARLTPPEEQADQGIMKVKEFVTSTIPEPETEASS